MSSSKSPNIDLRPDESIDDFMDGRIKLIQSKKGYRFSIDAILLSEFVSIKPGDVIVDLGTGCGIIPLVLLLRSSVGYYIVTQKFYHIHYEWDKIIKIFMGIIFAGLFYYFLIVDNYYIAIVEKIILLIAFIFYLYLFAVDRNEIKTIKTKLKESRRN